MRANRLEVLTGKIPKTVFIFFHCFLGSQLAESEEEKLFDEVEVPLRISSEGIFPFCFPSYKSPDTKDDMVHMLNISGSDLALDSRSLRVLVMFAGRVCVRVCVCVCVGGGGGYFRLIITVTVCLGSHYQSSMISGK